jgi:transglutaminase-like putative cysteine protease
MIRWQTPAELEDAYGVLPHLSPEIAARLLDPFSTPYRIPDTTQADDRLRMLDILVHITMQQPVAQGLARAIGEGLHTETECANAVLNFVQHLGYIPDPPGEWYQSGLYTIANRGKAGNCNDLGVLTVALLRLLGIDAWVWWIFQKPPATLNHVTARANVDGTTQWVESTIVGARLGENPYRAAARTGQQASVGIVA